MDQITTRLAAPFDGAFGVVVRSPDGKLKQATIPNCDGYLRLRPEGYEPLSQPDLTAFRIEGATCQALTALRTARAASAAEPPALALGPHFLEALPATMGPAVHPAERDRRDAAASVGKSWAAADPEARLKVANAWTAQIQGADWRTELEVLGRADFDGDGQVDLLVRTVSTGSEGSWSEVRLRLLTWRGPDRPLVVTREYRL